MATTEATSKQFYSVSHKKRVTWRDRHRGALDEGKERKPKEEGSG